jgi:hypothetical protein
MKIAFCGDSFCENAYIRTYDWPWLVAHEYRAQIILSGKGGNCFYHSFQDLFPLIDEADYIVFCITDPARLANRHRLPLNFGIVEQHMDHAIKAKDAGTMAETYELPVKEIEKILKATYDYFKLLISSDYHHLAQHGILKMVDELMVMQQKKCIWLPCFDDSMGRCDYFNHYIPKSGPLSSIALHSISWDELLAKGMSKEQALQAQQRDERRNHFNSENNHKIANMIIDIIKKDNFLPRPINIRSYFELVNEYMNFHIYNQEDSMKVGAS